MNIYLFQAQDSIQLTNSTGSCQQTIAAHRITQIECDEKHLVHPFSHEGSGATTNIRQSLTFIDEEPIEDDENSESIRAEDKPRIKSSLLFQHAKTKDSTSTSADSLLSLPSTLQLLCQNTEVSSNKSLFVSVFKILTFILDEHLGGSWKRGSQCFWSLGKNPENHKLFVT